MSKIIVVGANHAGTACINTILDNYQGNEVVVFDQNSNISFLGCGMALWIGKQIDGPEGLFYSNPDLLKSKGATLHMETTILDIDVDAKVVKAQDKEGNVFNETYDKLILATGSNPIIPPIEGRELENVQQVKLYQNAQDVINKLHDTSIQNVVVVGGGYIGVELAEAFKRNGKDVTLIDVAKKCLTAYYDDELTTLMDFNLNNHGIKTVYEEKVLKLVGNGKVEKLITDKNEYACDMVILAVGFKPNASLCGEKVARFKNGAYLVDKKQETSIKGVYAIGDCATVYDNSIDDVNYIALATNAVRSGIVAAHNACGTELESVGVQGSNGICIYELKMVSTGLNLERAKALGIDALETSYRDLQKPGFIKENNEVFLKIIYEKGSRRILGAQMASDSDISGVIHMFSLAIQEKVTIDKLKLTDIFFLPHFNQPYNYITMAALNAE